MFHLKLDLKNKWRSPSQSELTPMLFNMGLIHLGSEASKSIKLNLRGWFFDN